MGCVQGNLTTTTEMPTARRARMVADKACVVIRQILRFVKTVGALTHAACREQEQPLRRQATDSRFADFGLEFARIDPVHRIVRGSPCSSESRPAPAPSKSMTAAS